MMRQRQGKGKPSVSSPNDDDLYKEKHIKNKPGVVRPLLFFVLGITLFIYLTNAMLNRDFTSISLQTPPRKFVPVPPEYRKTFYADSHKLNQPIMRSLRSRGWQKVNSDREAHLILTYRPDYDYFTSLKPWQRYVHFPGDNEWNSKELIIDHFKDHEQASGREMFFLPESYRLSVKRDLRAFQKRLDSGGRDYPWVLKKPDINQGKGIEMIGPNSKELERVVDRVKHDDERYIIQQYICNEMTWGDRKFDVRMFWYVASLDPLLVFYHDGYARIGNSVYDESHFDNTRSHLTTHTGLGEEGKGTFDELSAVIQNLHKTSPELQRIPNPVQHVRNQFKHSLGELIAGFRSVSFPGDKISSENALGFYGADYVVDNDLDVWLIEPQRGCGLDEDYNFRVEMHNQMFTGVVDVLEEIWQKQEEGKPVLPLKNVGKWELVYADGWQYSYDGYTRSKNKRKCGNAPSKQERKLRQRH